MSECLADALLEPLIPKWQKIADLLAELLAVPAVLIMRTDLHQMEVFLSSATAHNPYPAGAKENWHSLYCETVIKTQQKLLIPDATRDPHWNKNPDRQLGMIAYLGYPLNFPDGRPFGTLCALDHHANPFRPQHERLLQQFRDVLQQDLAFQEMQQQLQASRDAQLLKRKFALETGNPGVWEWDPKTGAAEWNDELWSLFGIVPHSQPMSYETWRQLVCPEDLAHAERVLAESVQQEGEFSYEFRIARPRGTWRTILSRGRPLLDVHGQRTGRYIGSMIDITELTQVREALRLSEERTRLSTEMAGVAIWEFDVAQNTMTRSRNHDALYGLHPQDPWRFETFLHATHPDDRDYSQRIIAEALQPGGADKYQFDFRVIWPDGTIHWLAVSGEVAQRNPQGHASLVRGCLIDITGRKTMEERLRQAEKLTSLGQLAGGVAHNFNNQLAGVLGFAEMLENSLTDEPSRRYAAQIIKAAQRCADLTAQLLAFARKGKYQLQPVDLHQLLAETNTLLERTIDKRITIQRHGPDGRAMVLGDATQLQQMLLNLSVNARDAMPAGGQLVFETAAAELTAAEAATLGVPCGPYWLLRVTDSGAGMLPEVQQHLFEPFFTTKEVGKGVGLGLASVHGTVVNHLGAITVRSAPGHGTTFSIYLPRLEEVVPVPAAAAPPAVPAAHATARLLLVDDEELIRALGEAMLRHLGYEVIACADGVEAVAYYRSHWQEIALVILDVVMPRLGGRETLAELRAINPAVKVLVSSGYSIDGEAKELLENGAQAFLQKPFSRADLSQKVAELLVGDGVVF
jgi:PAS domain S-box-containing protein